MVRCVDCGFLAERRARDGKLRLVKPHHRQQLATRVHLVGPVLRCYVKNERFDHAGIRGAIDFPVFIRLTYGQSPTAA